MALVGDKNCTKCGASKPLSQFPVAKKRSDGRGSECRTCMSERHAQRRLTQGHTPRRVVADGYKWCSRCQLELPLDRFGNNRSTADGRAAYCKTCHNQAGRESKERVGGSRQYHLKRRYGLSSAEVDQMIAEQGGRCAVCRERDPVHVDHCHLTGDVRGILCFRCNAALGNVGDSVQNLRLASTTC